MDPGTPLRTASEASDGGERISRRRFIGYVLAAPTLVAAAELYVARPASASVPTVQAVDAYDLNDMLTDAAMATSSLIKVTVNDDGTVSFALPRAEVGQGITTAAATVIADEMDVPIASVNMTLADADPDLLFNQFTGSSNSMHALYPQLRTAAAVARGALTEAAARRFDTPLEQLRVASGVVFAPDGRQAGYGSLTRSAAVARTHRVVAELKPRSDLQIVGTPQPRIDALDAITGREVFAMDLEIANALPTMICRPPTINGSASAILNKAAVLAMPGVTDVVLLEHTDFIAGGVAVRAATFGQCIDAVRALEVTWKAGTAEGKSDADVLADLEAAELPLTPAVGKTLDQRSTFYFRPGDPLETNCAVADVRSGSAEVWSSLKSPIWTQQTLAQILGIAQDDIAVHVVQGGGSFGRHLFADAAFEAALISQKIGKPVKLMWHRTDSFRQGRCHPMVTSRVRISYAGGEVVAFDQRHTSVASDFSMGLGEILSAMVADLPAGGTGFSETVFTLTASVPYNFGPVTQLLNEIYQPQD